MCFSEHYSILNDFPRNRFGILPRYGTADEVKWFACEPTYVLHWLNAFEEVEAGTGHTVVVLDGYFMRNAEVFTSVFRGQGTLDFHKMAPQLYRWRFNLGKGT